MSAIPESERPAISHGFRLQWEEAQNAHVLLYPEGMVRLNTSAGEILRRCDGAHSVGEIVAELEQVFARKGLAGDVIAFVSMAKQRGWLEPAP
jgi:pyrroloquinoline quinone biosynthesis protein D